jgi:hypothetical protein
LSASQSKDRAEPVVGDLKAFDVKVMLGKADRVVAEIIGKPHLLRDVVQHSLIKFGPHAGETRLDLAAVADGRKIEKRRFHPCLPRCTPTLTPDLIIAARLPRGQDKRSGLFGTGFARPL